MKPGDRGFEQEPAQAPKTPRVCVVGCGHWGRNLVRNFCALGSLAEVCEVSEQGRETAANLCPGARITSDFDEALEGTSTALVIATPAETHYRLAKRALESGRDVLVEKPLALKVEDGNELVQLAERDSRILMVGHVLEYHPGIQTLLHLIESGKLGTLHYIYSNRLSLGKIRREENILWSFAPHDIAVILRIVGSMPRQVTACGGNYVRAGVADVTVTNLTFEGGVKAHIHVSWLHPFKEQRLVVIGSKRMATFDDVSKQLVLYDQRVEWHEGEPIPVKGGGEQIHFEALEPLEAECRAFFDSVVRRVLPVTSGQSGLRVLKVLDAAQRSLIENGTPMIIQPGPPPDRSQAGTGAIGK